MLIDITHLPGLSDILLTDEALVIGALVRHADILRSDIVRTHAPLLAQAVQHVAHPAIRNRGTIGGSLSFNDPAAEYPAVALALGAMMVLRGPGGVRRVPASAFFRGLYATDLRAAEMLEAIEIPRRPFHRSVFLELARRHGDYAMVGVAVHGAPGAPRAVFFAVGDGPIEARHAAAAGSIDAAKAALADDLQPPSDLNASSATRLHLARVLLGRALTEFNA